MTPSSNPGAVFHSHKNDGIPKAIKLLFLFLMDDLPLPQDVNYETRTYYIQRFVSSIGNIEIAM